jgi:hypothetical protein
MHHSATCYLDFLKLAPDTPVHHYFYRSWMQTWIPPSFFYIILLHDAYRTTYSSHLPYLARWQKQCYQNACSQVYVCTTRSPLHAINATKRDALLPCTLFTHTCMFSSLTININTRCRQFVFFASIFFH